MQEVFEAPLLTRLPGAPLALVVAMVGCIPIFTQAVTFLVLRDELDAQARSAQRPPFAVRFYANSSTAR